MKRVLVLGSSGSGKSTLSNKLGKKLGIDVIHLDSHYWQAGWKEPSPDQWKWKLAQLLERESWIMDGNYHSTLSQRLEFADTAIFLDLDRVTCFWRCVSRYLKYNGQNRPEMADGCKEKIDIEFIKWIWNYPRDIKPVILELLAGRPDVEFINLRGTGEINGFLSDLDTT